MLRATTFVLLSLNVPPLLATTFSLEPGWNLLGTLSEIPTSQILAYPEVRNVVIFDSTERVYKSTNNNQFSTVPAKSGFFIYSDNTVTINISTVDSSVLVAKLDGNGAELPSDAISWNILHVKDAGLYVEMKNDFTVGQRYLHGEATNYCTNLIIGSVGGWRLPTNAELTGIGSLYTNPAYRNYFTTDLVYSYWSDTGSARIYMDGSVNTNYLDQPQHAICVQDAP